MIVCHCRRVTDRAIRKAVREGAGCHNEVARACGAGTGCGGCVEAVIDVIGDEVDQGFELIESPLLSTT